MPREELHEGKLGTTRDGVAVFAAAPKRGWGFPSASKRSHYFIGTRSLCGRWAYAGELDARSSTASQDDCAECTRRLASHRAPAGAQTPHEGAVLPSGALDPKEPT